MEIYFRVGLDDVGHCQRSVVVTVWETLVSPCLTPFDQVSWTRTWSPRPDSRGPSQCLVQCRWGTSHPRFSNPYLCIRRRRNDRTSHWRHNIAPCTVNLPDAVA